jgi:hypothetical protein
VCPAGAVIIATSRNDELALRLEVSRDPGRGLRQVGDYAVTIIGEIRDRTELSESVTQALGAVVTCLENDPTLRVPPGELRPAEAPDRGPQNTRRQAAAPWRLLLAFVLMLMVFTRRARGAPRAQLAKTALPLAGLTVVGLVGWWLAIEPAFFHQNGQGPMWIEHALCGGSSYGPGYEEIFAWLAGMAPGNPEPVVFGAQAVLGALWPLWIWLCVRETTQNNRLAWAVAIVVAADPLSARLAHSESYYAAIISLLLPAAAVLVLGTTRRPGSCVTFALAIGSAGLLVAQAARIHPVAWVAAASIPAIVLLKPGAPKSWVVPSLLSAAGIGAVVLVVSGPHLLAVLEGSIGQQWMQELSLMHVQYDTLPGLGVAGLILILLIAFSTKRRRSAVYGFATLAVIALAVGVNLVEASGPAVEGAYYRLYLGPVAVGIAGLWALLMRSRASGTVLVALLLSAGIGWHTVHGIGALQLPTDAIEQNLVREWREQLAADDRLVYLGRSERRVLSLPLYGACDPGSPERESLRASEPPGLAVGATHYYRSSVCSATDEGAEYCRVLESGLNLEAIWSASIPAIESMPGFGFQVGEVTVHLYRLIY